MFTVSKTFPCLPAFFAVLIVLVFSGAAISAYDLLIITPADYETALEPLAEHKERTDIYTRILTLETIREEYDDPMYVDDPERIKHAIYDRYLSDNIQFVMLVGDGVVFPVRYTFGDLDDYSPGRTHDIVEKIWEPSDLYYADILDEGGSFDSWDRDGNDLFGEIYRNHINNDDVDYHPDVFVGRVPAEDVEEVRNYVAKVIRYEYVTSGQAWFNNMTFSVSHDPDWNTPETTEAIVHDLTPEGFSFTRYYHHDIPADQIPPGIVSDGDPTSGNLTTSFNNGTGFVFHHGHGGISAWHGSLSSADIRNNVSNPYRLPVIFATSCETSRYCPYIPYNHYWGKDGSEHGNVARGNIGTWLAPEPDNIQVDTSTGTTYNHDSIGEEFIVDSENGAIAYWGSTNTGEGVTKLLGWEFFSSFLFENTLGEMWAHAIECYYDYYGLSGYTHDTVGGAGNMWIFHTPQRHVLFGDPSLRVGGCSGMSGDDYPPSTDDNVIPDHWYRNDFALQLYPEDNPVGSGSGVHHTYLSINGGTVEETRSHTFSIPEGTGQGFHLEHWSVDFFEREETPHNHPTIFVDAELPGEVGIAMDGDPPTLDGNDFSGPVTVTLESFDAYSGVNLLYYYLEESTGIPDLPWWERYSALVNSDPDPGDFSDSFEIDQSGCYRVLAWATDHAGNVSAVTVSNWFTTTCFHDPFPPWFRDLAHIMHGPANIWLPPELELPFDPDYVDFYIQDESLQWILVHTDAYPGDDWGFVWDTTKYDDGLYNLQAIAHKIMKGRGSPKADVVIVEMATVAVRNRPDSYFEFYLDESPRTADRGELVYHEIAFTHDGYDKLTNCEILFDLSGGLYDLQNIVIYNDGEIDQDGVIHWTNKSMYHGDKWNIGFKAGAGENAKSGHEVTGAAYLRCDQIPIITSDDPQTPGEHDPTAFTVLAEDGIISGTVMDAFLLQPLESASVSLAGQDPVLTDQQGKFIFENVIAGTYTLAASFDPLYGDTEAEIDVDGDYVMVDMLLDRNDLTPPKAFLDKHFDHYVENNMTYFTGTSEDNMLGSGVGVVELSIRRLSDDTYWEGSYWDDSAHWFYASGTEDWSLALPRLDFDSEKAYILSLRVTDMAQNSAVNEHCSRPPAPEGLVFSEFSDSLYFSWDPVPGCGYLLEVNDSPFFSEPVICEYLGDNGYSMPKTLEDGVYYWRVYSHTGTNVFSKTPEKQSFTISEYDVQTDLRINGSDGPIQAEDGSVLNITVSIDSENAAGEPADYFLWVVVPELGDYWYQVGAGWTSSETELAAYQGVLLLLTDYGVGSLTVSPNFPRGSYTFHFAVDLNQDGLLDPVRFEDTVIVDIE